MDDGKSGGDQLRTRVTAQPPATGRTLRATLLLPLATLLSLLALAGAVLVLTQYRSQRDVAESGLRDAVDRLALLVERELVVEQSMLEALSMSASIDKRDWPAHYTLAQRVAARRPGALIALTDASGQLVYNTAVALGTALPNLSTLARESPTQAYDGEALPVSSQGLTARARQSGAVAYSDLYYGVTIKRPAVALAVPVLRDGAVPYTLTFSFPPDALNEVIGADKQLRQYRLLVVDRNGRIIAGSADAQAMLNHTVPQPLRDLVNPTAPPAADGTVIALPYLAQGTLSVTGRYLQSTGWTAIAAMPPQAVYGTVERNVVGWLVASVLVLAAAWLVALRLSLRIAQPLAALTQRSRTPHQGPPWPASDVREIGELTEALREAERLDVERSAALVEMRVAEARAQEARAAEREVRERETQLRLALLAGQLGFWRLDAGSGVVTGDLLFRQAWGLDERDATSAVAAPITLHELIGLAPEHERDRLRAFFSVGQVALGRRSIERLAIHTPHGRRWLALWADVLLDTDARRAGLIGVAADITQRVQEGEQLGDRNTQLRLAMESALAIAFDWDIMADRVRRWESREPMLPETTGEPFEAVVAQVHPDDRDAFRAQVQAALASDTGAYRAEFRLRRPDGEVRWLSESGRVLHDAQHRPLRLIGVSLDITEQKRLLLQLEESRASYHRLLNSIDQGFCVLEMLYDRTDRAIDYRFLEINRTFELHTGLKGAAGRRALEMVPHLEPEWIDTYDRVARTGVSQRFEQVSAAMGRLFSVEAVRVGGEGSRRVALLFSDITQARAAQDRLRDSEQRYRMMFQGHPQPMWVYDVETLRFLEVNGAAVRHYGFSADEFAAMTLVDIRPPEEMQRLQEKLAVTDAGMVEHAGVSRHRRKDGSIIEVQVSSHGFDYAGRAARLVLAVDVTERRRALEQLERTSETFYRLVQNDPFGLFIVDADFRLREASRGARAVFGALDPLIGRDFAELLDIMWGPAAPPVIERFRATLADGAPYASSIAERRADRAVTEAYDWRIERMTLPDGRYGVVCYFYDLTDRQRWERQLQESEARFRAMANGLPLLVWATTPEGASAFVNETCCEFFGLPAEQMTGERWRVLLHPDDAPAYVAAFFASIRSQSGFNAECRMRRADGQWRWIEVWGRPRRAPDGEFMGQVGCGADITERKRIAEDLRNADRQKDEFLATLAHELRNPLAPIRNVTQLLEMNQSAEVVGRGTQILRRQVRQMNRLLDDLLDVSRLTLKRLRLQTRPLDLHDVIADALEQSRPLLDAAGQSVVLRVPSEPVMVEGDRERLAQVVSNLLNNAARYSAGPAEVTVTVELLQPAQGRGPADGGPGASPTVELRVRDRGVGIAAEDMSRIFGMLVQGQTGYQSTKSGLGIGLSLVHGLVQLHGGTVQARSDGPGQGAEFIVRLPALPAAPRFDDDATQALAAAGAGQRVLVVDDNVDSADSMALLLSTLGYVTRTAYTGMDALRLAQTFAPAAALLDIGLPDIDGLEVARRLRATGWGKSIHLIALSGWGQEEDKRRSAEAGIEAHLTKPADPVQLRELLERLLK